MNNIRKIVNEKSLKITRVAKCARISRSHFYDIMCGLKNPSIKTAQKIATTLGVTIDELFPTKADDV